MTEKRFTVQSSYLGLYTIFDGKEMKPLSSRDCVDLLNAQHEEIQQLNENEQLKQQIKDMKIRFKRKYDHEFDEIVDELW